MVETPSTGTFPFGRPVLPRPPSASTERRVFVLGAYPSALHVAWRPPSGKSIKAMAVDNEPEPFWNGNDEGELIARWKNAVGFRDGEWGEVVGVGALNGSSGQWVDENVLAPLRASRDDARITDCLDTYFSSTGGAARMAETYVSFAERVRLPAAHLPPHPSEASIVEQGVRHHRDRLLRELAAAAPDVVVTLGNAALRVLRIVTGANHAPAKLRADSQYGAKLELVVEGRHIAWLPLAHPAAPRVYQDAHERWRRTLTG
jgi:uracil-DNA glycosylase